jgi:hypothetical protein
MSNTQIHSDVPTSNAPPMGEWARKFWYVLRVGALQAHASLDDAAAEELVGWFRGFKVTTPCPECRANYAKDWALTPFTLEHAKDTLKAIAWVEDLRARISASKAPHPAAAGKPAARPVAAPRPGRLPLRAAATVPPPPAAEVPAPSLDGAVAAPGATAPLSTPKPTAAPPAAVPARPRVGATTLYGRAVGHAKPRAVGGSSAAASAQPKVLPQQSLALRAAVQKTATNIAINKPCKCGKTSANKYAL